MRTPLTAALSHILIAAIELGLALDELADQIEHMP